jgi:sphingolipid 4-desaturase/C4-monooxygenase
MRASNLEFTFSEIPEPHATRRRRLLAEHPEIRQLYGYDVRPVLIMGVVVVVQFAIAAALQGGANLGRWWGTPWFSALVAYGFGAFASHWGGVVIHEAAHNLCAPTTRLNRWVAIFANLPTPVPSAMSFRRFHMDHHRFMGVPNVDNDLPQAFEIRHLGGSPWRKTVWLIFFSFFGTLARGFLKKPQRWEVIGAVVQLATNAFVLLLLGWTAMGYLLFCTFFSYGLHPIAGHFIHEHYLWKKGQETYSYYGPLNAITLNLGYHNEHHDFMRVPGRRLPELHRIASDVYESLESHRSWTWVLWHFIRTPSLGHHSRMARVAPPPRRSATIQLPALQREA